MTGQDSISGSIFKDSQLAAGDFPAGGELLMVERIQDFPATWFFFMLFALIGVFAWIRSYYGSLILQTVQATTNYQVALRMFKDNSVVQKQLDNILYLFYFLNMAFLLYLLEMWTHQLPYGLHGLTLYLFNLVMLAGIFLARIVLLNVTGFLFNRTAIFREYLYNVFIFNKLLGIIILPLLPLMVYTNGVIQQVFYWTAVVVVFLTVLLRVARGVVFSLRKDISKFYMFLYLCALEIVPLMLLYNWIEGVLSGV